MTSNAVPYQDELVVLNDQCTSLAEALRTVIQGERTAVIALDTEKVMAATLEKNSLTNLLKAKRAHLFDYIKGRFACEPHEVESHLTEPVLSQWNESQARWKKAWEHTVRICEGNQLFLKHSVKNFDLLISNLKTLFGEGSVYNQRGVRKDISTSGRVVEAKY